MANTGTGLRGGVKPVASGGQQGLQDAVPGDRASHGRRRAAGVVREQLDRVTSQTGIAAGTTARSLHKVAQDVRGQGQDGVASVLEAVASGVERAAGYVRTNDSTRIVRDLENLARSQPWAVAVGGMTVGFFTSRLLRASSSRRYYTRFTGGRPVDEPTSPVRTRAATLDLTAVEDASASPASTGRATEGTSQLGRSGVDETEI